MAEINSEKMSKTNKSSASNVDAVDTSNVSVKLGVVGFEDPDIRGFYQDSVSESYRLKSELVGKALADIGMGKFQWGLFIVTGFGWIVDNFWSQGITAVRPAVANEFTDITRLSFSSVAYYIGLILGATFWGTGADIFGRKFAYNATILYGAVFALASAGTQNFVAFCALWSIIGTAAGGNVPVDSIVFLEFLPQSHQWLLVTLSAWWNFGQVIVSLISWVFLANFACAADDAPCAASSNMGWRYVMITLGGLALVFGLVRIFVFKIPESPRFLLSKGRDAEAVEAVNYIARYNGKADVLTLDMLQAIDIGLMGTPAISDDLKGAETSTNVEAGRSKVSVMQLVKESFADYRSSNYKALFQGRKLAQHSSVTFLIWLTIGIAYPLYFAFITSYLSSKQSYNDSVNNSFDHTYMVYCIVSAVGIIGPLAAGFLVETRFGRRWMMALSAALTGVFLFIYTVASTEAASIGFQCATGILGNFEYAIMFAFTPESFPGPVRGTGTGLAATLLRLGGLAASLVSTYAGYSAVPIYVSAALWVLAGIFCLGLPYETQGHASV